MFPAAEAPRRQLCETELEEVKWSDTLPISREAAVSQDDCLVAAISKAIGQAKGHSCNVTSSGNNNSGLQLGVNPGTIGDCILEERSSGGWFGFSQGTMLVTGYERAERK